MLKKVRIAFAQNVYGCNVTERTSEIAENAGAILAVNGDYYGAQETGYVLRNGVLYWDSAESGQEDLVIYEDGSAILTVGCFFQGVLEIYGTTKCYQKGDVKIDA